jgi:hypothetical protein
MKAVDVGMTTFRVQRQARPRTTDTKGGGSRFAIGTHRWVLDSAKIRPKVGGRSGVKDMEVNRAVEGALSCPACVLWLNGLEAEVAR